MASITKHAKGWRAQVARQGTRLSMIHATKRQAQDWAAREEHKILSGEKIASDTPLTDVLDKYAREVSPEKRGHRWEVVRLAKLARDMPSLPMSEIQPKHIAAWRDRRLREVSGASVRREMQLLSAVFNLAKKEWGLISSSPMDGVKKPASSPPRDRLPMPDELEALRFVAGSNLANRTARAFHAFLFASETAMRAGEIIGLTRGDIDLDQRVAHLPMTKNGSSRTVPLSSRAIELLRELPDLDPVFGLKSSQLDSLFRKIKMKADVKGLHFHDSRAAALTKMARLVDVLTLAKISGHRDLRILSNTYYRETAQDIALRLG